MKKPTVTERQAAFSQFVAEQSETLLSKGHDYTAGQAEIDAYANFRLIAMLLEGAPITPYTVAMIYKLKHLFSLLTFCKTGTQESGEALRGRHVDDANYTFILDQLTEDHEEYFKANQCCPEGQCCPDGQCFQCQIDIADNATFSGFSVGPEYSLTGGQQQ